MVPGLVILALGSLVALYSYSYAQQAGGAYTLRWGAIVFGAFDFIAGLGSCLAS